MSGRPFSDLRADLYERNPESRQRVAAKVKRLTPNTLADMRRARGLSQEAVAEALGTKQSAISRIEHQTDWLLSTVQSYARATGGRLRITVEYDAEEHVVTLPGGEAA